MLLTRAGDQVPVIPFVDVTGARSVAPEQIAATGSNVGVRFGLTVTLKSLMWHIGPHLG